MPQSDHELLQAHLKNPSGNDFGILVDRHLPLVHSVARRITCNDEAARDAVQDAFVKAYSNLAKFEGRSSFYTWFYRLVMNQCLDMKRGDKGDRHVEYEEGGAEGCLASSGGHGGVSIGVPLLGAPCGGACAIRPRSP